MTKLTLKGPKGSQKPNMTVNWPGKAFVAKIKEVTSGKQGNKAPFVAEKNFKATSGKQGNK
jgi:hypothetical protein